MVGNSNPEHDSRSVGELFEAALNGGDEWRMRDAIAALHWRGTPEVLDRATSLCVSECPYERRIGADILGQLGLPERSFPRACADVLLEMLAIEIEPEVLNSIFVALSFLHEPRVVAVAPTFASHSDANVRFSVVLALSGLTEPIAVGLLIQLASDVDSHVRDWATFGLGTQLDLDTPEIRNALADQLSDTDEDTRCEAIVGLARRQDKRAIAAIISELSAKTNDYRVIEAVEMLASPALLLALIERQHLHDHPEHFDDAIAACRNG
jgi:HEAT repeat protein